MRIGSVAFCLALLFPLAAPAQKISTSEEIRLLSRAAADVSKDGVVTPAETSRVRFITERFSRVIRDTTIPLFEWADLGVVSGQWSRAYDSIRRGKVVAVGSFDVFLSCMIIARTELDSISILAGKVDGSEYSFEERIRMCDEISLLVEKFAIPRYRACLSEQEVGSVHVAGIIAKKARAELQKNLEERNRANFGFLICVVMGIGVLTVAWTFWTRK